MVESTQHILGRIRSPRVQITYDVEIGNAIIMKELPFVIGIMSDLSGMLVDPLPPVKFRKFVEIDRDNFSDYMVSINARLAIQVQNMLDENEANLNMELFFKHMEDFSPINIAKQVPALNKIYVSRVRLSDLVAKLEGNDILQHAMSEVAGDAELRATLKKQIDAVLNSTKQTVTSDFVTTDDIATAPAAVAAPDRKSVV